MAFKMKYGKGKPFKFMDMSGFSGSQGQDAPGSETTPDGVNIIGDTSGMSVTDRIINTEKKVNTLATKQAELGGIQGIGASPEARELAAKVREGGGMFKAGAGAVSYTHLTLPTILLV